MTNVDQYNAGLKADLLIATEVAVQDKMWGDTNERADATKDQLLDAAIAQQVLVKNRLTGSQDAVGLARAFYPQDWDGFRDYGSTVANLVVASAYLRSEIKRRILLGEDTTRTKRGEDYRTARPYVSAEQAAASLQ